MYKIKKFEKYIKENILFPRGGNIGGEHKKPVSDEEIESGKAQKNGYKQQPKGISHSARMIEDEKRNERKINLMGSTLSGYYDKEHVRNLISTVNKYKTDPRNYFKDDIISYLNTIPKDVIEHFNIDLNSDNLVEDFIENKFDLFKRSFNMFEEIKDYSTRYSE